MHIIILIALVLITIEIIVFLSGYFIFDIYKSSDSYVPENHSIFYRTKDEVSWHFWVFYHLKAYSLIIIISLIAFLTRNNSFLTFWLLYR